MTIPSVSEYIAKLEGNPAVAAAFDAATPGKSRREAVEACHKLAVATLSEIEANKQKLVLARAKIAALEKARAGLAELKAFQAKTGDRALSSFIASRQSQPTSSMKPTPSPVKATPQATITAAAYATAPLLMTRSEFSKLTPADKNRYMKDGGKLI